jgi:hypothetical protein
VGHEQAVGNAGIVTWTLGDGASSLRFESGEAAGNECAASVKADGPIVRLTFLGRDDCVPGEYEFRFLFEDGTLHPTVVATTPPEELDLTKAFFERPWTRID